MFILYSRLSNVGHSQLLVSGRLQDLLSRLSDAQKDALLSELLSMAVVA